MFSGAVKIADVSDFISPSQDCVVQGTATQKYDNKDENESLVRLHKSRRREEVLVTPPVTTPPPVTITLNDCLACAGCVTTAETVLLQAQSAAQLAQRLGDGCSTVVVTLAPQSVAALAAATGTGSAATLERRLAAALRSLGVRAVFSVAPARDLALADAQTELVERLRARGQRGVTAAAGSGQNATPVPEGTPSTPGPLPLLASACPGWVCYAEKTHGAWVLPHLSRTASPQAIAGRLIKRWWARSAGGLAPRDLFHCAVMPCYDKKLEAARADFLVPGTQIPETDCVLSTSELAAFLEESGGVDLRSPVPGELQPLDVLPCQPPREPTGSNVLAQVADLPPHTPCAPGSGSAAAWWSAQAGGSGGYLAAVFEAASRELGRHGAGNVAPMQLRVGRNADIQETTLEVDGQPVFRAALCYGFRNIQGLVRRMRLRSCPYDYVEVMACPSGCLNGGGQIRPLPGQSTADLVEQVEAKYGQLAMGTVPQLQDSAMVAGFRQAASTQPGLVEDMLHTQFHHVQKSVGNALKDW